MRQIQNFYLRILWIGLIASSFMLFLGGFFNPFATEEPSSKHDRLPVIPLAVPLSHSLEDYTQHAVSGGPGKDGIPAIDAPRFLSASDGEAFMQSEDVVFGAVLNGEIKAYPQKILVWHEIVNDRFGQENVSVTYCPLTGTALGFKRGETSFGVSGLLINNNLIMFDRATDSRWPQILGTAISGPLKEKSLQEFRLVWTTWKRWRQKYPETTVLSTHTGSIRNYRRDPYGSYHPLRGYYAKDAPPLFPLLHRDQRFAPKEVVLGARTQEGAIAFKKDALRTKKILEGELDGTHYTAIYEPHLDTGYIYKNPHRRQFSYKKGRYREADKKWQAPELPLEKVNAFDAMWFAWSAFYPETRIYE
jgi:hypothetical protein